VSLLMVDPGFRTDRLISLEAHVYARVRTPQDRVVYFQQAIDVLSKTPGVIAAAAVSALPFHDNAIDIETPIHILDETEVPVHERPTTRMTTVTPGYFKLMRIPLRKGRFFSDSDGPNASRVAIINEAMARRFFPDRSPIGRRILIGRGTNHQREIVGVVGDTLRTGLDESPRPEFFLPHGQSGTGSMTFVVRTASEPWGTLPAVKEAIWSVKSGQPFAKIAEVKELMAATHSQRRFHLSLIGLFAGLALLLAAVALFGLVSHIASQRRGEIGVRIALGASMSDILRLIVGEGIGMAAWGVAIGFAGALITGRVLRTMLFGVTEYDPLTFALVPVVLFAVVISACAIPAWRASQVDASRALRAE
jgi:putative ABC transport system permease protein